jgi:hypothetical protein
MKSRISTTLCLITCIFLTSMLTSHARPTLGGIEAGTKFTLKVVDRWEQPGRIPPWMPHYRIGQHVTFKIGKNGQLKIPCSDISLMFLYWNGSEGNDYMRAPAIGAGDKRIFASLHKDPSTGKPTMISIRFFGTNYKNMALNFQEVNYIFK